MHRIHRRKSGSEAATADCIASNVARLTLLPNSDASSGLPQRRRRSTMLASPLIAFIAAEIGVAIVGQAAISASNAALRTAGSGFEPSPRTAGIESRSA